jgi:hypothetical protein
VKEVILKIHCVKNCILSDHGQNHSFWGCDCWFRKMNSRHRAIQEKIFLDRLESFQVVQVILGDFRPFLHSLGRFFQVLEILSIFPEK